MKIHVLGSGHASVLDDYNTCFVIENENKYFLVDSGGGARVLKQLSLKNINVNEIEYAFVTHNHTDHALGFAWIIRSVILGFMKGQRTKPFTLIGSELCVNTAKEIALMTSGKNLCEKYFDTKIFFKAVENGQVEEINGLHYTFFDTYDEDMPQMAFFIKEKGFAFCGDVPLNEKHYDKFKGVEWLALEAFCLERQRKGREVPLTKHNTVKQASAVAQKLKAKNLILWHSDDNHIKNLDEYIEEARLEYTGNIYVPGDLETIEI